MGDGDFPEFWGVGDCSELVEVCPEPRAASSSDLNMSAGDRAPDWLIVLGLDWLEWVVSPAAGETDSSSMFSCCTLSHIELSAWRRGFISAWGDFMVLWVGVNGALGGI